MGVIACFALGLAVTAFSADKRHGRGSIVITTDKGRITIDARDVAALEKLRNLKDFRIRIRGDRRGKIDIDMRGLERSAKKMERSARRLERKIERKLKRVDSREGRGILRILEGLDLDLDLDFDFDFDWDWD